MKTVLKLVIAVAVVNAVVRAADSAWDYYQFKDAVQRALLFGSRTTSQQLHRQIMQTAEDLQLSLRAEDLSVRWRSGRRIAIASYTQQIEFLPNYPYPVEFEFNVDTPALEAGPSDDEYPPVYADTKVR
jgi:hypothetical protein